MLSNINSARFNINEYTETLREKRQPWIRRIVALVTILSLGTLIVGCLAHFHVGMLDKLSHKQCLWLIGGGSAAIALAPGLTYVGLSKLSERSLFNKRWCALRMTGATYAEGVYYFERADGRWELPKGAEIALAPQYLEDGEYFWCPCSEHLSSVDQIAAQFKDSRSTDAARILSSTPVSLATLRKRAEAAEAAPAGLA
jgi:hypothetical protein